jgi:hypothetical protein
LTLFDERTPAYTWILAEIIAGLGLGGNFQNMLIAIQATIHYADVAVATATFSFIILLGATMGIAIGGTVLQNQMNKLSAGVPGLGGNADATLSFIQGLPEGTKEIVMANYAKSLRMVWIVLSVFAAAGFLASFAIGTHELYRE